MGTGFGVRVVCKKLHNQVLKTIKIGLKEQSRTRLLDREQVCSLNRILHLGLWVSMSTIEMGWQARLAVPWGVVVERFAMLVSTVGVGVGRLNAAYQCNTMIMLSNQWLDSLYLVFSEVARKPCQNSHWTLFIPMCPSPKKFLFGFSEVDV